MSDLPGYDTPGRLFRKIQITRQNHNQNRKYFYNYSVAQAALNYDENSSKVSLDSPFNEDSEKSDDSPGDWLAGVWYPGDIQKNTNISVKTKPKSKMF